VSKPIASIFKPSKSDWFILGQRVKANNIKWLRKRKYHADKPYTKDYATKKANRTATPGASQKSTSSVPDATLLGGMLDNQNVQAEPRAVEIVWTGIDAAKVAGAEKNGRPVTTDAEPLIKPVDKELLKDIDAMLDGRLKQVGGTERYTIRI